VLLLATDTASTIVTISGSLAGVLVGGGITYYGQTKLERRRENRERKDSRAQQERRGWELTIEAYANAWSIRAEAESCTAHARAWIGNEATLEELRAANDSMDTWRAARVVFADVLQPVEWLELVKAIETFAVEWNLFLVEVRRSGQPMSPDERRAQLDALQVCSEGLISRNAEVVAALRPLFDLGEAAEFAEGVSVTGERRLW
jgi:hypothetical protein